MKTRESGATLILSVLLLAAITVLVGFGRLAMYRNQVKLRLDREREIQQELATRSAMRWLEVQKTKPTGVSSFYFETIRGNIGVILEPAIPVFPNPKIGSEHYDIAKSGNNKPDYVTFSQSPNYVPHEEQQSGANYKELVFGDYSTKSGKCGVYIDLTPQLAQALWTETDYGLRYLVYVADICKQMSGESDGDKLRLCLTPYQQAFEGDGRPGTHVADCAIWMEEVRPKNETETSDKARISLHARQRLGQDETFRDKNGNSSFSVLADLSKGFQLASTKAALIQQRTPQTENIDTVRKTDTHAVFDMDEVMGSGFVESFQKACENGVRLSLELVIQRPRSELEDELLQKGFRTAVTRIAVTPAYEYYTTLQWPNRDGSISEEVSTVIRYGASVRGEHGVEEEEGPVTYDTHGTYANRKGHLGDIEK